MNSKRKSVALQEAARGNCVVTPLIMTRATWSGFHLQGANQFTTTEVEPKIHLRVHCCNVFLDDSAIED